MKVHYNYHRSKAECLACAGTIHVRIELGGSDVLMAQTTWSSIQDPDEEKDKLVELLLERYNHAK